MRKILSFITTTLLLAACTQDKTFVLRGSGLDLPDGTVVGLSSHEMGFEQLGETVVKDGAFELHADITTPVYALLTTNNLNLVEQNGWPVDSIRWNYIDCYVSACAMQLNADLTITGGQPQSDFADYEANYKELPRGGWRFILDHPSSVVSADLALAMLQRGYNLSAAQLDTLEQTIAIEPADTARAEAFAGSTSLYRRTVKGGQLLDMEMQDTDGKVMMLSEVVPAGKYVFIDFWASWCGICLYSMPEVKRLTEQYADRLAVIGISCDKDSTAWRAAMEKYDMPWPHYLLTEKGYQTLSGDYQVGGGVPYYLLLAPDGTVLGSPDHVQDIKGQFELLEQ